MWNTLIRKIENQSVLIVFIVLLFGTILLKMDNSLSSPAGVLGALLIGCGAVYTLGSFFAINLREGYEHIINKQQEHLQMVIKSQQTIERSYQRLTSQTPQRVSIEATSKRVGKYELIEPVETSTTVE